MGSRFRTPHRCCGGGGTDLGPARSHAHALRDALDLVCSTALSVSETLKAMLALRGGERLLEIGPGTGAHARPIAASLVIPLAELLRRAGKAGFSFERKTGLPLAYLARFGQVNR